MMLKNKVKFLITVTIIMLLVSTFSAAAQEGGSFYGGEEKTEIAISGELNPEFRFFSDDGDIKENLTGNLELTYPGRTHEFKFLLDFQPGAVAEIEVDELYYRYYGDKYNFLLGKNRLIWGKGDQLHVVDNLNGEDMSDFVNQDYRDRQIGEEMIKIDRYFRGGNANLEFVYTPNFTPNRLANDPDSRLGNWIINPFAAQSDQFTLKNIAAVTGQTETEVISQIENSFSEADNQFAIRFTDSRGGTDYGFSYYKGYLREPSYDLRALSNISLNYSPTSIAELEQNQNELNNALNAANLKYDEVDVYGFELARVIADINSRFELAYYRTDDTDGNDPAVRNNKIAWVIGGDRDLPFSNLSLNLQFTGHKILDNDQIENNMITTPAGTQNIDLEYDEEGDYTTNRVVLALEDSYQNGKIIPQLSWVYNLKDKDYSLQAALDYELKQDLVLTAAYKLYRGDADTTFGQFENNDYSSLALSYNF